MRIVLLRATAAVGASSTAALSAWSGLITTSPLCLLPLGLSLGSAILFYGFNSRGRILRRLGFFVATLLSLLPLLLRAAGLLGAALLLLAFTCTRCLALSTTLLWPGLLLIA